jgi:autotransporter-associated beta strand protein
VVHEGTGTALLRSDAANALGTGTVTLNARATLENNAANGLNSLTGVKLTTATSTLTLGANPWTNPSATLTAENGTILLGTGASTIGTFILDSPGTVTLDADTGGSLAATSVELRQGTLAGTGSLTGLGGLTKSTDGTATMAGNHTYTGDTLVSAGTLLINGSLGETDVTVATDATIGGAGIIGGSLHFESGSSMLFSLTDTLTVNGTSVSFDGFSLANLVGFDSSVPDGTYTLIDGDADFDFTNLGNFGLAGALTLEGGRLAYFESGSLQLVVIPEPRAALLGGLGLLALLRRRR